MTGLLVRLLVTLHPRSWRAEYGEELADLLGCDRVTAAVVLDVLRNAARQHARAHARTLRLVTAALCSVVVEVLAVRHGLTDNVLWLPSSLPRTLALAALLLCWLPVVTDVVGVRRHLPSTSRAGAGDRPAR